MRAAIDIGSNSLLLTVVDEALTVLHDEARVVGMGRGLGDGGAFRRDRMDAATEVLGDYVRRADELGVPAAEIRAVATSGARRATNATVFFDEVRAALGLTVRTVSGQEEARLSFLGARWGLETASPVLVVDLGGGSTEVVLGDTEVRFSTSLEMGAVRLTERFENPDDRGAHILETLSTMRFDASPRAVVNVAGTATTLAAIDLGLEAYDPKRVHGSRLSVAVLRDLRDRLDSASPLERQDIARVSPERAPYLAAGADVLARLLAHVGAAETRISDRGLRFGLLL